jgi:uncharacterized membrane protein
VVAADNVAWMTSNPEVTGLGKSSRPSTQDAELRLVALFQTAIAGRGRGTRIVLAMISQIVATFACGVFFGAAVYINLVEQPARISCGTPLALTQWRPSYKRGTLMQAPLALIGSLSALIAWRFEGGTAWLVGGLLLLLVVPLTLVVILPTNKRLERQELDLRSEEAGRLLRRWGRLHAIRSILSGAAFLVFLSALAMKR